MRFVKFKQPLQQWAYGRIDLSRMSVIGREPLVWSLARGSLLSVRVFGAVLVSSVDLGRGTASLCVNASEGCATGAGPLTLKF